MGFIFNFIKRIIKLFLKLALYLAVFASLIVLIPNLPPYTKFTSIALTPAQPRVGPLAPNNVLNNVEQKYKGKLLGPEAFQVLNGELYTSLSTGEIVKISPGGHITFVTKVGLPCTGLQNEHICGRPLGFQIDDKSNSLYVADAYHGIWKIDLKTDKKQLLVSPHVEIRKRSPKLFNDLALDTNGDFYWTDSSSDFNLKDGAITVLTDPSGRVFHYNAAKNESTVLIDDLWFPNGVALSPTNDFLVITETCRFRILKHYISGPKKGQTEVFVDGLPGLPDNVRVLPDGSGVLVGLYSVFDDDHPVLQRSMSTTPLVRKFLARLQLLIQTAFEYLNSIYPHIVFQDIIYHIGHFKSMSALAPAESGLAQIDWNGKIVAAYFNNDKTLAHISDAIVYNDKLYIGNPHLQDFIGAVPVPPLLKTAFKSVKTTEPLRGATKPEQARVKIEEKPKAKPEEVKSKEQAKPKVEQKETPKAAKIENKPTQPIKEPQPKKTPQVPPKATSPPTKPTEKPTSAPPKTTTTPPAKTTPPPPKTTTPPPAKTTTPPPAQTTAPPPKSTPPTPKTTPSPSKITKKPEQPKNAQENTKTSQGKVKEQIPIKEDIPLDTAKPVRETLKVIKKGGVTAEIPVPNNK